jgi:hypothetical protein
MIEQMKNEAQLHLQYSQIKAVAYAATVVLLLKRGQLARRALAHFENQLEVLEAISDDRLQCKDLRSTAKSKCVDGNNNEELLKAIQE